MANQQDENEDVNEADENEPYNIIEMLSGSAVCTLLDQPMRVVRILIYLGYEPFPLTRGKSWFLFGKDTYFLPNRISYGYQLACLNGFQSLYTGFTPSVLAFFFRTYASRAARKHMDSHYPDFRGPAPDDSVTERSLTDAESLRRSLRLVARDSVAIAVGVVASQPFHVVSSRMIAELVNNGNLYSDGMLPTIGTILSEEGPGGLFGGLIPHLASSLFLLWGTRAIWFVFDRVVLNDSPIVKKTKDRNVLLSTLIYRAVSRFTHPYGVVAVLMAVSGSGLSVGGGPYPNWLSAWDQLGSDGRSRGRSVFWRRYNGDVIGTDQTIVAKK